MLNVRISRTCYGVLVLFRVQGLVSIFVTVLLAVLMSTGHEVRGPDAGGEVQ